MNQYAFILSLVREAGEKLKQKLKNSITVSYKGDDVRAVVTNADIDINTFLISRIKEAFPDHGIYSEESDTEVSTNEYMWMIDPLDGSANFARNIPHFAISVVLLRNHTPVVGAVYNPITNELFSLEQEKGAFLNDIPIQVSRITDLAQAQGLVTPGHNPALWDWSTALHRNLLEHLKKVKNLGSSALDLSFLAAGRADVVIYGTLTTQDCAAAISIVRAAGGEVYTAGGEPVTIQAYPQTIVATANKTLLTQLLPYLRADLLPTR